VGGFQIGVESLRSGGRDLETLGAQFGEQVTAFQSRMAGFGQPWGNGYIGSLIGAAYVEVSEYLLECLQIAAEELEDGGVDVAWMADSFQEAEDSAREAMAALASQLG
jgi:hypothetical protein